MACYHVMCFSVSPHLKVPTCDNTETVLPYCNTIRICFKLRVNSKENTNFEDLDALSTLIPHTSCAVPSCTDERLLPNNKIFNNFGMCFQNFERVAKFIPHSY